MFPSYFPSEKGLWLGAATKVQDAFVELDSKADIRPLDQMIESIRTTNPAAMPSIADNWLICALAERDGAAAKNALIAFGENPITFGSAENVIFNRPFVEGVIARMTKEDGKAQSAFTAARKELEKIVQAEPNYAPALCVLGLIDAGLGRKEKALREGRRAVELLPLEKDALDGSAMIKYLAMIAAWVGDKDLACEQLAIAIRRPSDLSYGQLKLMPLWDPLRWRVDYCIPSTLKLPKPRRRRSHLSRRFLVFDLGRRLARCYQLLASRNELLNALQPMVPRARFTGITPWGSPP